MSTTADAGVEPLLEFLKANRGFDFTGYKRTSLERRIRKRMQEIGVTDYAEYIDFLEVHPAEFQALFDTILINVTRFFRDPEAWDYLRDTALPALLERRGERTPLRVWCVGCASGEEAYTLAIVLCELMGEDAFRECVKIYATDLDEGALDQARQASYTAEQLENVPEPLRDRYFEGSGITRRFRADLRRTVIFGRNDVVQDAPISRVDILLCRNTLMYFNVETQAQIVRRFNFALRDDGVLVLGKSEMLVSHPDLFEPVDLRRRVFRPIPQATVREGLRELAHPDGSVPGGPQRGRLREQAFDRATGAQLIVDPAGLLVAANTEARGLFTLGGADLNRPFQDLEVSYRPVELRTHLDAVARDGLPVRLPEIRSPGRSGEERIFEVRLTALRDEADQHLGTVIAFQDVTLTSILQAELERNRRELEAAHEELQSTVEELETTNEELQATNEELETTNEELQSSNEELETTNEELQSTNDELETMNEELQERAVEVEEVNLFLETILTSMGTAVAVIDPKGMVQVWNSHAEDLWGLRGEEAAGQPFLTLDIGLPVEQLGKPLRNALSGRGTRTDVDVQATNRRGRPLECHVSILPLTQGEAPRGAIILMSDGAAPPAI